MAGPIAATAQPSAPSRFSHLWVTNSANSVLLIFGFR
jgi:hypothetical protein